MKNIRKRIFALGCIGLLLTGMSGCGKKAEEKNETVLEVVTDPSIQNEVKDVADFMMKTENIEININVLPAKDDGRDTEIQKLQTQILAGKGADVYLLDTDPDASDIKSELFANPYQTMQSGALASLDKYMEADPYWKDTTYNMNILTAGKHNGKQYIIPLSCYYYILSGSDTIEKIEGNTLGEWLEQVQALDDSELKKSFKQSLYLTSGRWFQPAADYETRQVLFNKEEWKSFSESYFSFQQESEPDSVITAEDQYQIQPVRSYFGGEGNTVKVIPDTEGRKMASIMTYGAVGMSSSHKEKAYEFLMLFLNDNMQKAAEEEGTGYMPQIFGGSTGIPAEQNEIRNWLSDRPDEAISAIEKSFEELEGAYFVTNAERDMISDIRQVVEQGMAPENGWDQYLSDLADKTWEQYEMQVKE